MLNRHNKFIPLVFFNLLLFAHNANAKISEWDNKLDMAGEGMPYKQGGTYTSGDVANYIGKIILIAPFLGSLFILHLIMVGYEWMTAAGDAKKVEDAKKRLKHAIIGLILLVSMYILAVFIVNSLTTVTQYNS